MSIKTLKKRIAVVAVSALTAGVLSVASAPVANAAFTDVDFQSVTYTNASSVGVCSALTNDSSAAGSGVALSTAENLAQAGEILLGGSIVLTTTADAFDNALETMSISISGPAKIASVTADGTTASTRSYGAGMTSLTYVSTGTTDVGADVITITPSEAGVVQVTVSKATAAGVSTTLERMTWSVSASCVTGTASVANSFIKVDYADASSAAASISDNTTQTYTGASTAGSASLSESADRIANGGTGYILFSIQDGTATAADVTTQGVFSATATNGAVIGWEATALALQASSATKAGPTTGSSQAYTLQVTQGTANKNKPMSTVVSLFFNGVLYGTRTITFTGIASKITINPALSSIGAAGTTAKYALVYEITDSAGNKLTTASPGISGASGETHDGTASTGLLASADTIVDPTQSVVTDAASVINTETSGYIGTTDVACGKSGKAKVQLYHTRSDLVRLTSDAYEMRCGGTPTNYKASLDKASYVPGEIATLTITATDEDGFPVYDLDATPAGNDLGTATTADVSISLPVLTAVAAPTNTDEFSGGTKTYKFTVGSTEGSFTGVVSLPRYNTTTYSQAAQTVSYKVAGSTATVSNADVLKSIVALIASINKQIQALQKLILKR